MNPSPTLYFRNVAATISYVAAGYVRLDWQAVPSTANDLKAIYEHVLQAMQRYRSTAIMSVHNQRPAMPPEVQSWLVTDWIPRAVRDASYTRCAVVEAATPMSRLAARAVGIESKGLIDFRYFDGDVPADTWLRR